MDLKVSLSEDELRQHRAATIRGALTGGLIGAGIAFPTFYLLIRRSSYYRAFPFPIKLLGSIIVVAPLVVIQAEKKSLEFDRQHWTELGKSHLERREHEERERWVTLSPKDKVAEWAVKHQLSVIIGSWATTMAVAGSVIMRDPLSTMPQKVVQVRLWAQGLTIGVIIAAAVLTHAQRARAMEMRKHGDHFWQYALEDERLEKDPQKTSSA
ncbi:hypothetical protein L210DRAFT_274164 [Boletus edulis BED1]|uniref:HIG1 domain-containing protein n=1 Tax=Boletus edulis BED1 TaxID=1328754 RepID=A0AAD4GL27_BOLED|nr:hypothetical protein L210DRAFT_274164 [Boletus edulis BED1]